ncbi:Ig-like domain-containing protein [Dehalobacter sp. DCM]|uniref:Ig-like domain-containing protein n=1 Tax=Dehalobacter sp. DCM TaxID=2907827 RepID=UPI003081B6E0|nr:Ig-like domain-containing protein [Dehalobacter sp. DCM]
MREEKSNNLRKMTWKKGVAIGLVILLAASVIYGINSNWFGQREVLASEVTIKATDSDRLGVETNTSFQLTSSEPLSEKQVKAVLKTYPEFLYTLDKQDRGLTYTITPQETLKPNTVYRLSYDPEGTDQEKQSWAFQTKATFMVLRSLPSNQSTMVPIDTGIELTFTADFGNVDAITDYFAISPAVDGTFEKHKNTLVFVPQKPLQPSTVYTVTLKKGYTVPGTSDTLAEDHSLRFETASTDSNTPLFSFDLDTSLTEFSTTEPPVFPVYFYNSNYSDNDVASDVQLVLYRYPDYRVFQTSLEKRDALPQWSYYTWNRYLEKIDPSYKTAEYQIKLLQTDPYNKYVVFPEKLQAGYYAAELKAGDTTRQVWFEVTDLAVYFAQGQDKTLFWVNDLQTKKPAANVAVSIANKNITAKGDASGTVLVKENLNSDFENKHNYAYLQSGGKEILVPLQSTGEQNASQSTIPSDYWKYLYLDRELYKPGDTVNFWGIVAARDQSSQGKSVTPVNELTLELYGYEYYYDSGREVAPILTTKVPVQNKTFTGQIQLPILKPGYYELRVKAGDTVLISRSLSVENYRKPAYQLTLTADKKAVFAGEKVNFLAKASFFEGTPVPGLSLHYQTDDVQNSITTNSRGEAAIPYTAVFPAQNDEPYRYTTLFVNAVLPEAGELSAIDPIYVFKSNVYITGEAKRQTNTYTLNAKLSSVDLSKINNGEYPTEENFLQGPVTGSRIKAALFQEVMTKVKSGQHYDYISKKVVPSYYYTYSAKQVATFDLTTGADGTVTYTGKLDPKESYYLKLTATDASGRAFTRQIFIGSQYSSGTPYYHLEDAQTVGTTNDGTTETAVYTPGEKVTVTLMVNEEPLVPTGNNILYFHGQSVIDSYQVSASSQYSFDFTQAYIPNVNVYAVYFDGYKYNDVTMVNIPFAANTKTLAVTVTTDKKDYRPGEQVSLMAKVTDAKGNPLIGAQVNINLVDEALFHLQDQYVNLVEALYGDYRYLYVMTRKSHDHPDFRGGAESGGEGGGERSDFRDTVLFTTLQTDNNGQATTAFTLPDNLTSWRVTYQAFTSDLHAGSGTSKIPVTLPFFIDMTMNDTYLAGDAPVILLRSYGTTLKSNQTVSYRLKLTDPQGNEKTWTESVKAFASLDWKLPVLTAGEYTLTVSGNQATATDTLSRQFIVAKTFQQRTVSEQALLQEGQGIAGSAEQPTTLIFSNYEKSQYLRGLYELAWSNGSRLEQKLAAQEARKLLKTYFSDSSIFGEDADTQSLLVYQQSDGGISILPHGESELALTAMVAVTTPDIFDHHALIAYFDKALAAAEEKGDDPSLALMGLAALNEPVLLQIENALQAKDLAPEVQINLALALLELGDGAYAQEVYQKLLSAYGQDLGSVLRINVGKDQDEIIQATTRMALLAARLDESTKNKLYQYLLENTGTDILNSVEQLQILTYNLKYMKTTPVSFTYELNGSKVKKTLNDMELFEMTLLPQDLNKITFSGINGKVGVISSYTVPIPAGETQAGQDLSISRNYRVNAKQTTQFGRSDLVEITITYDIGDKAPQGVYEVVDILPAGLAFIPRPYNYQEQASNNDYWDYPSEANGQRLVFYASKAQEDKTITYLARVVSPGEFNCENPVLSNISNPTVYTSGNKGKVVIK